LPNILAENPYIVLDFTCWNLARDLGQPGAVCVLQKLEGLAPGLPSGARPGGGAAVVDLQRCAMRRAALPGHQQPSLKHVVERWLNGATIDKAEQCSDWGRRPLTPSQFEYAALDAEVLLALDRRLHDAGVEAPHPEPKPRARELVS
jgi:hypothetical protein